MLKKFLYYIISIFFIIALIVLFSLFSINSISTTLKIVIVSVSTILFSISEIFKIFNINTVSKMFFTIFIIFVVSVIVYIVLYITNLLFIFSSVTSLKNYILNTKEKGVLIYILLQLLQVMFLPIPASIICIVGSLIYGPWIGGLYCSIGVLLGSYLSFFIGKIFGYRIVSWIVGKESTDKYSKILRKRGGFFLAIAFLLPMFPDDILCLIAGITKMQYKKFFLITLITRPIGVICMAIFGGGYIIPFSGWGIYAWIAILIVVIAFIIIIYKWQDNIQDFILNKIFKKLDKDKMKKQKIN